MTERWTVLEGDCRDVARRIEPASIDLIIADPPYGETSLAWDRRVRGWVTAVLPCLKPSGSLWAFGSLRSFLANRSELEPVRLIQDVIWEKHNGTNFHNDRFKRVHEQIAQFIPRGVLWRDVYKSPVHTLDAKPKQVRRKKRPAHMGEIDAGSYVSVDGGPRLKRSVLHVRSCHGYAKHETQKPTELLRDLIEYSSPPRGVILAPFAGSGSDLVAAMETDRSAIGIDIDPRWCREARLSVVEALEARGEARPEHHAIKGAPLQLGMFQGVE